MRIERPTRTTRDLVECADCIVDCAADRRKSIAIDGVRQRNAKQEMAGMCEIRMKWTSVCEFPVLAEMK